MGIVGFSFLKINSERNIVKPTGKIEINHNISISNVEKTSLNVGGNKNDVLRIEFTFDVIYGNNLGKINLVGDVIYADTKEIIEESKKIWDSDKKLNKLVNEVVLKFVYSKVIVKALEVADSLNLPAPVPMPSISFKPNKKVTESKK